MTEKKKCKKCDADIPVNGWGGCILCWLKKYKSEKSLFGNLIGKQVSMILTGPHELPWYIPTFAPTPVDCLRLSWKSLLDIFPVEDSKPIVEENWTDKFQLPPPDDALFEIGKHIVISIVTGLFLKDSPRCISFRATWSSHIEFTWEINILTHYESTLVVKGRTTVYQHGERAWQNIAAAIQTAVNQAWRQSR